MRILLFCFSLSPAGGENYLHSTAIKVFSQAVIQDLLNRCRGESDKPGINNAGAKYKFIICVNYHK